MNETRKKESDATSGNTGSTSMGLLVNQLISFAGREFGCGIFVSSVLSSSKAAQNGLKVLAFARLSHSSKQGRTRSRLCSTN